jgi:Flp pilus assembly protein TadD
VLLAAVGATVIDREQTRVWRDDRAMYEHRLASRRDDALPHRNLGIWLLSTGEVAQARAHLVAACSLEPENPAAHYFLAEALRRSGERDAARAAYERALGLLPSYVQARTRLAEDALSRGDARQAWALVEPVQGLDPDIPFGAARIEIGVALVALRTGRCALASARAERALERPRPAADVLLHAGEIELRCGRRARGLALVQRAAERAASEVRERVGNVDVLS